MSEVTILSLGAGVQSSTLALMAAKGVVSPIPFAAVFADTGDEPKQVYEWLEWLKTQLPFQVHTVFNGTLSEESTRIRTSQREGEHFGKTYLSHNVPAYTINSDGSLGNYRRQCTDKHKLVPLNREIDRLRNGNEAIVWIGISRDEIQRMKESQRKGVTHKWPLIDLKMTREISAASSGRATRMLNAWASTRYPFPFVFVLSGFAFFSMNSMMSPATSTPVAVSTPSRPGEELTSITTGP